MPLTAVASIGPPQMTHVYAAPFARVYVFTQHPTKVHRLQIQNATTT
jgi:hypothetical protein